MWKTYLRRVPQFILTAPSCKPVFHSGTQYHSEFRSITKFPNPASKHCYDSDGRYAHSLSMTMSSPIKAALIDLSGTLHIEDIATQGAQDALCSLLSAGIKVKFVTNTTKVPLRLLHQRLQDMQFTIKIEDMFTSLTAARSVVEERCLRPFLMLEESAKEDFKGVLTDDPNAVVIGLSPSNFNYPEMNHAFGLLMNGASLIAIHKGRYYQKKDGLHIGPGPFVEALQVATGADAVVVGKPEKDFFHQALKTLSVDASEAVMIGDDVQDDVGGAQDSGIRGMLVQTGKYRKGDENTIQPEPFQSCQNFAEAVNYILKYNSNFNS